MCTLPDSNQRSWPKNTVDSTVCQRKDCRSPDLVAVQAVSDCSYPATYSLLDLR
jgi:hypothetical protein